MKRIEDRIVASLLSSIFWAVVLLWLLVKLGQAYFHPTGPFAPWGQ